MYALLWTSLNNHCGCDSLHIEHYDTKEEALFDYKRYCQYADEGSTCYTNVQLVNMKILKQHEPE